MSYQFLSSNLWKFNCTKNLSLKQKLLSKEIWKSSKQWKWPRSNEVTDLVWIRKKFILQFILLFDIRYILEDFIDLLNQVVVSRYVVKKSLRNNNTPIIVSLWASFTNCVTDSTNNIFQSLFPVIAFFWNNHNIWTGF